MHANDDTNFALLLMQSYLLADACGYHGYKTSRAITMTILELLVIGVTNSF